MSGKVISGPAAVLLIAFFFFPWILVSCEGTPLGEFSGYQLAMGTPPESAAGLIAAEDVPAEPILFAVPLAGVISLILLAVTLWKADFEQHAAWGQIVLAAASLVILLLEWWQWGQKSDPALEVTARPALWMSFIALLALIAGAVVDLFLWYRARPSSPPAPAANLPRQSYASPIPPPPASPPQSPQAAIPTTPNIADSGKATIIEEDVWGTPDAGKATIVEDDLFTPPAASQPTIVEDDLYEIPGAGQATIVEDDYSPRDSSSVKTELLHFEPEPIAQLVIESGKQAGKQIDLYGDATIGRVPENDIVIDDTAMSSYHARIQEENGRFTIIDLNSTNGVYISGVGQSRWKKQKEYDLSDGDKIKLGRVILQFRNDIR
ncbi:MAG TPA: FHA domain-containing protein [Chloroflexi bacterium]|nr:FHA domain-containing protein [Chloroflexota bacterium]